jgi:hypothetical protein
MESHKIVVLQLKTSKQTALALSFLVLSLLNGIHVFAAGYIDGLFV